MKRLVLILLSVVLIVSIAACKRSNPDLSSSGKEIQKSESTAEELSSAESSSMAAEDGGKLFADFTRAMYKGKPSAVSIETDETMDPDTHMTVSKTKELLDDLAYLLSKMELIPQEIKSVSGDDVRTIQISLKGEPGVYSLRMMVSDAEGEPYTGKMAVWLQVGEEMASLVGEVSAFEEIAQRIQQALTEQKVTLEGNFLPFQSAYQAELDSGAFYNSTYLQWENRILCVHISDEKTLFETLDVYTGEMKDQFSVSGRAYGVEKETNGYSVWYADRVEYRSVDQPETVVSEIILPEQVASKLTDQDDRAFSYRDGKIAYAAEDGIYWGDLEGEAIKILDNAALPKLLEGRLPSEVPEGFSPSYIQPRIVNGGSQVIALMLVPGSQIGCFGLSVYDTQTGEIQSDPDFFSVMQEGSFYPDDRTIAVMGIGTYISLDIPTFEKKQISLPQGDYQGTADGKQFVGMDYETGEDGIPARTFYTYSMEDGQEANRMLLVAAAGDRFHIKGMTDHVILCEKNDTEGKMMLAVTYH